ncbi:uncharacterized protein L201_004998 [Kwoniella dendrophila CBS 6074]|uniref:Trafficking protein particle complex subunit 11 domain-containing protein n=1 Tax=Kwoniella dendrophila CBS 6074 TaxID=1295534 RepID=A0AAX4JZQ2_9TREE
MNSYPNEFLAHPQPLMFVAGLNPSFRERSISSASATSTRRPSGGALSLLEPSASLTTPITSPTPKFDSLPSQADEKEKKAEEVDKEEILKDENLDENDREFEELVNNLRSALTPMGGKGKVWLSDDDRRDFRIILVDKNVRLPMRKISPSSTSSSQPSIGDIPTNPHSPLSPLIPSSPLYPDGLIAPVWIRKHAELVPSVFVLFLRLYEAKPIQPSGDAEVDQAKEAANKAMEKDQDDQLIREIGDRRRRLGERGIKLTVVLMASAATLDSPALDPRLSYLRRASALSAKASLFVLTPVPADQLPDFVQSLQDALFDSAMEYYSNHAKRVRRKRSRVPISQNPFSSSSAITQNQSQGASKALRPQGWAVRYDWKAGWFAEVRGDFDTARRHYEDCWNELAKMFSSTTTLPPRTKRWAEAKVLADCVAIRICKLLLYDDQGPRVLNPFFVHIKRFGDLSRGWGIGEETFEFWSWIARQYRIFAELLEMAQQSGLRIASLAPPVFPTAASAAAPPPPDYYTTPISSGNPLQVLQQPAFYYYTAASCSVQRQVRYQEALAVENDALALEAGSTSGYISTAPGFANEKKVDHAALVIELFTKSYSLLKEQEHSQNRMALFVAFRIAEVYCQSAQYDMALRFFDRISQGFKRERWSPIVRQIRKLWYQCAQQTGNVETAARLLVEMMSPDSGVEGEERAGLQEDLLSLMKTTTPSSTELIIVDLEGQSSLLDVQAGFWQAESTVSKSIPYQIVIRRPAKVDIGDIQFSALRICWSDGRKDTVVSTSDTPQEGLELIQVDEEAEVKASLKWTQQKTLVINGEILGEVEGEVQVSSIKLSLKQGSWDIQIHLAPEQLTEWVTAKGAITPVQEISPVANFIHQPHDLDVEVTHLPSAFIGEDVEVMVKATNNDERDMDVTLSVFLQPGDDGEEDDGSTIHLDDESSSQLIKDISLGTLSPSSEITKIITLRAPIEGTKMLDFSIQTTTKIPISQNQSPKSDDVNQAISERAEEINKTAVIPILRPFDVKMAVNYSHSFNSSKGAQATVGILVEVTGPREIKIENIQLLGEGQGENPENRNVKLVSSSLDGDDGAFPQVWNQSTSYALSAVFALSSGSSGNTSIYDNSDGAPANLIFTWSSSDSSKPSHSQSKSIKTIHQLPTLSIPQPKESYIIPTIHLPKPSIIKLNEPFEVSLSILNSNPNISSSSNNNNIITVIGETLDGFVWLGQRNIIIKPSLRSNEEINLKFKLIALSLGINAREGVAGEGWITIPKISVYEGEEDDREEIKVRGNTSILVRP